MSQKKVTSVTFKITELSTFYRKQLKFNLLSCYRPLLIPFLCRTQIKTNNYETNF